MIKSIADHILKNFDKTASEKQPEKDVIIGIIEKMKFVLFVEYFGGGKSVEAELLKSLEYVFSDLKCQGVSAETAEAFMRQIPALRETLKTDVEAAFEGDPAAYSRAEIIISYPGLFAVMVQRMAHILYKLGVPLIPRIMTEHAKSITGIDIHPGAEIGQYFFIDHGTGVVVGETAIIGSYVKIYQSVTLGALSTRGGQCLKSVKRHPTLEDYVTVYSGATILGGETVIGKGATIGGNAFITKSIREKTKVSVKNPELQFVNGGKNEAKVELEQSEFWDYVI
ncbi:MAG: serine acetyltransferase [Defluviitaleaceae bacterium]|nr:serine acetyltransferase [Defluviitaleaceae bacterium]